MKVSLFAIGLVAALAAGTAGAQSGADLFKAKGCANCHDATVKKVGPSVADVAAKAKGNKGAEEQMVAKLKDGKGHMKIAASDAELKAVVGFMLTGK